ncbi:hypothetical protein ACFSKM_11460 [Ancylobacter dichloromethanicus]
MSTLPLPFPRLMLGLVLAFGLAGCPGESGPERGERVVAAGEGAVAGKTWLQPTDDTAPEPVAGEPRGGSRCRRDGPGHHSVARRARRGR